MILTKKDLIEAVGKKIGFSFGLEKGDKKVVKRIGLYLASKGLRLPDVRLKHLYEYQGLMYWFIKDDLKNYRPLSLSEIREIERP